MSITRYLTRACSPISPTSCFLAILLIPLSGVTAASQDEISTTCVSIDSSSPGKELPNYDPLVSRSSALADLPVKLTPCFHDQSTTEISADATANISRSLSDIEMEMAKGMAAGNMGRMQHAAEFFTRLGRDLLEDSGATRP